ncbi:VWA domain-containing protein [Pseudonocardia broussonetiae]|uniref:VWA domain-containing protein n=1 Tax=Pseudonocardia broussonetiae TaxID=2736640 RepID=A0A6M6JTG4_9PSEU|nr:VWA domain-containing protein [Pseudonocardia broussonetiae]
MGPSGPDPADADPIEGLVGFTVVLRSAGLAVTTDRVVAFLSALDALDVTSRTQTYWAGRLTLCSDPDDLPRYDRAFEDWFTPPRGGGRTRIVDERQPPPPKLAALTPSTQEGDGDEEGDQPTQVFARASGNEVLRNRDLAELTPAEREHLRRLLALLRPDMPTRRSRRMRPSRHGPTDPGRTLRAALRDQGEMRELRRRDHSRRPRRVVLLVDVSGSMEPYADALLRFAHVVVRRSPGTVEAFTLGTRLTRITRELRMRDADRALAAAGRAIPDWSGGTRLGEVMRAFVDRWGQRGAARRSVVVVFSDGWERGETDVLGVQMSRLHRLAHKLVWVNPHAGKDGYAPVQGGIVAALPYLDDLLAGHSLATLEELLEVVRDA